LRLDERAHAMRGGDSGVAAIVPGASGKSDLIRRVTLPRGDEAMPPGPKKLAANQIRVLRAWIDAGAVWTAKDTAPDPSPSLASPHYGERWARLWLDAARYADSDGFEKDMLRWIYFFRDWVVAAFNRDVPYDRFVIEQLAGDLLPNPTQDQRVATGFLRNSML